MNRITKIVVVSTIACVIAGYCLYVLLSAYFNKAPTTRIIEKALVQATANQAILGMSTIKEVVPTKFWLFKLTATAIDDPDSTRKLATNIEFQGEVSTCTNISNRLQISAATDNDGATAKASKSGVYCVPSCGATPPPAQTYRLSSRVETTAYQQDFEMAPSDFAPQGQVTEVAWQCGDHGTRLQAASLVALACNTQDCDDVQLANAVVTLSRESGSLLAPLNPVFPLRTSFGSLVAGSASVR